MDAIKKAAPEISVCNASAETAEAVVRNLLQSFRHIRLKVKGTCMTPALSPGVTVTVSPTHLKPPRMGDVVLVLHASGLKLHRIFWGPPLTPQNSGWWIRGDQSIGWDPRVQPDGVIGTVVSISDSPGQRISFGLHKLICYLIIGFLKTIRFQLKNR